MDPDPEKPNRGKKEKNTELKTFIQQLNLNTLVFRQNIICHIYQQQF